MQSNRSGRETLPGREYSKRESQQQTEHDSACEIGVVTYAILLCLRKISSKITAEDTLLPSSWEQEDVVILAPQGIGGRVLPDI
jgi:hypothetical protein